jgi:hypothetical protein
MEDAMLTKTQIRNGAIAFLAAWLAIVGVSMCVGYSDYWQQHCVRFQSTATTPITPESDPEAFAIPSLPTYSTKAAKTPLDAFESSEVLVVVGEGCPPCRVVLAHLIPKLVYGGWVVTLVPNQTTAGGPIPRFEIRKRGWTRYELHTGLLTLEQLQSIVNNHTEP